MKTSGLTQRLGDVQTLAFIRGDFHADDFWSLIHYCRNGATDHGRAAPLAVVYGPVAAFWKSVYEHFSLAFTICSSYTTNMNNETTNKTFAAAARLGHERLLLGTGFASWRTQKRRRIQVACALTALALYLAGALLGFPVASLFGLVLFLAFALLLRITTRGLADLPSSVLDERQLAVRNAIYVSAYRVTGGLFAVLAVVCIGLSWMNRTQISTALSLQTLLGALFLAIIMPSCLVAWSEREA